ncbi:MAG: type II secretion system F family protein [Candidatus Acidiferrales bacterium]
MALLIGLLALLVGAIVFGAFWLFFGSTTNPEVVRDRMEAVRKAEKRGDISLDLQLVRDDMMSSVPLLNRLMMKSVWTTRLQGFITQAGMDTKPGKILLFCGVSGLSAYVIVGLFYGQFSVGLLAALAGAAIPLAVVWFRRNRRLKQFELRFPEALDLLGRAVRAGHAFTAGLEMVSKDSPEPVASEFRTTFEEQNFGLPLRDALSNMAARVPLVDVRFFVTALLIQKDTGGNLAQLLDELARVIRERFRIYREVQIKTAQGRLTAVILIALPMGMLLLMRILNPAYVHVLFDDPLGIRLLMGAAIMQFIGAAILWRIVHIEV